MKNRWTWIILAVALLKLSACAPVDPVEATKTGNPLTETSSNTEVRIRPYLGSTLDMTLCVKRLRFKVDQAQDMELVLPVGELRLPQTGTDLSKLTPPVGVFDEIQFDLDESCIAMNGQSLIATNSNGTYATNQRITISFKGKFTINTGSDFLALKIQSIATALEVVRRDSDIKDAVEQVDGEVDD